MHKRDGTPRSVGILLAVLGFTILLGGIGFACHKWNFVRTASHAKGVVTEMRENADMDSRGTYAPVFEFADAAGVTHTIVSSLYSNPPAYHTGEAVEVLYQSGNPKKASINTFWQLWFGPLVFGLVGAVQFAAGMGMLLWPRPKEAEPEAVQGSDQMPHQRQTQRPNELPE